MDRPVDMPSPGWDDRSGAIAGEFRAPTAGLPRLDRIGLLGGRIGERLGRRRFRVLPWPGDPLVAYVRPVRSGRPPTEAELDLLLHRVRRADYRAVVTPALHQTETGPWRAVGFVERERLVVLGVPLPRPVDGGRLATGYRIRRPGRREEHAVIGVDHAAFPSTWQLDHHGLEEALNATPTVRHRVVTDTDGQVVAYAVCGLAAEVGYLQRLAVHPDHQGRGLGAALVSDALDWAAAHRADRMLVNTQTGNGAALSLYRSLGFEDLPTPLIVLWRPLP